MTKILQYLQIIVHIHNFLDKNLAIDKSYPYNLKDCQAKTTQKVCFPSPFRIEFGFEWPPSILDSRALFRQLQVVLQLLYQGGGISGATRRTQPTFLTNKQAIGRLQPTTGYM